MSFTQLKNTLIRLIALIPIVWGSVMLISLNANAANEITLECKNSTTSTALDFSTLGITISPAIPVGTVVYSGSLTVQFKCALDNFLQFKDKLTGEVYFKRKVINEGALGYGLTIYTGFDGSMGTEAVSLPTGQMVDTWAFGGGIKFGTYVPITLTVPYQIVRTSNSMAASNILPNYVNVFDVGSSKTGTDLKFYVTNLKKGITVKDQTCSVASDINQRVPLGNYTTNSNSGLGSGIGQTSPSTAFNIQLNCEQLLSGTFDVMMQLNGDAANGLSDMGVVSLNSSSTASGVGVQILNENQNPIALATPFNVAAYPLSSAIVTVPFFARYYQTAAKVNPGTANAVATYTISYQ